MSAKKKSVAASTKKKSAKKVVAKKNVAKKAVTKKKSAKTKAAVKPKKTTVAKKTPKSKETKLPEKTSKKATKTVTTPKKNTVTKSATKKVKSPPAAKVKKVAQTVKKAVVKKEAKKKPVTMKMTPFIRKQRQRLLDLRDAMVDTTQGITRDTLHSSNGGSDASGSGMHTGDAGSDAYDKDLALNILSKETDALYEIEEALLRIENKTYGICEMCGDPIPEVRLEALPFCRLTIACQTEVESKNGYGRSRKEAVGYGRGR